MKCPKCNSQLDVHSRKYRSLHICKCGYYGYEADKECCSNPSLEFRKYINQDSSQTLRRQCTNCGYKDPKIYPRKVIDYFNSLPEFDFDFEKQRDIEIREEFDSLQELKTQIFFRDHELYLSSPDWKRKRMLVFERDRGKCQSCMVEKAEEVHHLSYDHWGNEPLFDLVSVCRKCHEIITDMDRKRAGKEPITTADKINHDDF